jgi:hypothetical protein
MAHITLFKTAETGKVFRPEDHNDNMAQIETAVNAHDDAIAAVNLALPNKAEGSEVAAALALKADASAVSASLAEKADLDGGVLAASQIPAAIAALPAAMTTAEGDIDDLEAAMTVTTSTVDYEAPATSGSAVLRKNYNTVTAQIQFGQSTNFDDAPVVISEQIPSDYRPLATVYAPAMFCTDPDDGATFGAGMVQITADGYIKAVAPTGSFTFMKANVCWTV